MTVIITEYQAKYRSVISEVEALLIKKTAQTSTKTQHMLVLLWWSPAYVVFWCWSMLFF